VGGAAAGGTVSVCGGLGTAVTAWPAWYAEQEKLCAGATAGPWYTVESPWRASYGGEPLPTYAVAGDADPHIGLPVLDSPEIEDWDDEGRQAYQSQLARRDADLGFACAARAALPLALARCRALEEALTDLLRFTDQLCEDIKVSKDYPSSKAARRVLDVEGPPP
jgi:hypothetical protein